MSLFQSTLDTVVESLDSEEEEEEGDEDDFAALLRGPSAGRRRGTATVATTPRKTRERELLEAVPDRRSASLTVADAGGTAPSVGPGGSLMVPGAPVKGKTTAHHGVRMVEPKKEDGPVVEFLHRGTTVLHYESDTQQVTAVYLKLERCNGTVTWCRPPWGDPRRGGTGAAAILGHEDAGAGAALDVLEDAVSPGLRLKYTNRSGESLVRNS